MPEPMRIGRRRFVMTCVSLGGAGVTGVLFTSCGKFGRHKAFLVELARPLSDQAGTAYLAKGYLESNPRENGINILKAFLERDLKTTEARMEKGSPLEHVFRRCIQADYDEGRLSDMAGWFVSQTEARLLALAYLLSE